MTRRRLLEIQVSEDLHASHRIRQKVHSPLVNNVHIEMSNSDSNRKVEHVKSWIHVLNICIELFPSKWHFRINFLILQQQRRLPGTPDLQVLPKLMTCSKVRNCFLYMICNSCSCWYKVLSEDLDLIRHNGLLTFKHEPVVFQQTTSRELLEKVARRTVPAPKRERRD